MDDFTAEKRPEQSRASLVSKPNTTTMDKKNIHKAECELLSEIEFANEKMHKVDFFIKEMKERIRRHLTQYGCENTFTIEDQQEVEEENS